MVRRHFTSILLTLVASGVGASAFAADFPANAPVTKASPSAAAYNWSGFYAGGYWGKAIGQSSAQSDPAIITGNVDVNKNGWTAGATAGVNWQFATNWLIGLEGDIGHLGIDRSFQEWNDDVITVGVKADWYGTARGRFGYLTGPSLLYVTGGAAFVHVKDTLGGDYNGPPLTTSATTKTGWTLGGGIETKLSRNWSAKTEYLYIDAGATSFAANTFGIVTTAAFQNQVHVVKAGINYAFGAAGDNPPFSGGTILPTDHNWAGGYAGLNVGGGMSTTHASGVPRIDNNSPSGVSGNNDVNGRGFAGGAQVGYNRMNLLGTNWFAGVEADIGYLGIDRSFNDWNEGSSRFSQTTDWYGTLRGRIGVATGPALLYVTGGGAIVRVLNGVSIPRVGAADVRSATRAGWTLGGGTEVALNARWSAKLEYLYIDAGKSRRGEATRQPTDFEHGFNIVRFGLNYSFNDFAVATR